MPPCNLRSTLLVSLWHVLFHSSTADEGSVQAALRLLDAVGFPVAGDAAEEIAKGKACVADAREFFRRAAADEGLDWARRFFIHGAIVALEDEHKERRAGREALLAVLKQQQQCEEEEDSLFAVLARPTEAPANPTRNGFPSLFALVDASTLQPVPGSDEKAKLFAESKLYAALCLHSYFPTVKQLAKLLLVYIHQEETFIRQSVFQETTEVAERANGSRDSSRRQRTEARARGVIAGLLEFGLATARTAKKKLHTALHDMQEGGARSGADSLPAVGPRPEQTAVVLSAAALTLVQLVVQSGQLKASAAAAGQPATASSPWLDGAFMGKEIVHVMQEALFTVVLGAGTVGMPNRPARSQQQQQAESCFVVTHRPLTLHEVDAITQSIFPCLLQQLGYEWPWSELLRHCRGLDKLQTSPSFPFAAQSSSLLMEGILLQVAARTYPQRLENLLPESFDRLREKLGILPRVRRAGDGEAAEEPVEGGAARRRDTLFPIPEYYKEPVAALMGYFHKTKLGRLRVDEVEGVLTIAVGSLPMIVQLRALAPPEEEENDEEEVNGPRAIRANDGRTGARDSRSYPLTRARVMVLEARFKLECLLASLIVHTQLETHSQVQGMMRELAPLFAKLNLTLARHSNALSASLLTHSHRGASEEGEEGGDGSPVFTAEAEKLINDIGYQFYPLEWLPDVAHAFHAHQEKQEQRGGGHGFPISTPAAAPPLPYSVYAAVSHQLKASFHSPLGNGRNSPAGFRGSLVTAPVGKVYLDGRAGEEESGEDPSTTGDMMSRVKRAARLLQWLMLPCWLDARLSSCDLEGTMAVMATRAVSGGATSSTGGGGGSGSVDGVLTRLSHLLKPRLLELFWRDGDDGENGSITGEGAEEAQSRKRTRDGEQDGQGSDRFSNGHKLFEKDEEAVRALTNALLRHGASSFDLAMEAKDFVLTVAQCFLPSTSNLTGGRGEAKTKSVSGKVTPELIRSALAWCQSTVGGNVARADVRMQYQQQRQQSTSHAGKSVDSVFASVYNSCTFDACALARQVLLQEVPARLLEKMRFRQQQNADLIARRERCLRRLHGHQDGAVVEGGGGGGMSAPSGEVDKLLQHQWSQYLSLLRNFGFTVGGEGEGASDAVAIGDAAPALSAAQWMWFSPYSTH